MGRFCQCGADMVLCQSCGNDFCSKENEIIWVEGKGNVCKKCFDKHCMTLENGKTLFVEPRKKIQPQPISLFEHCRRESGLTDRSQIKAYMNRYYGHG